MIFEPVSILASSRYLLFGIGLASLCGCAGSTRISPSGGLVDWVVSGKISVQMEKQRETGKFIWRQQGNSSDIVLMDPFGRIVANLHSDSAATRIELAEQYRADPSLVSAVRERLPVLMFADWIHGRPFPASAYALERDEQSVLRSIRQQGWLIEYLEYRQDRVRKMRASNRLLSLVMVVTDWHLESDD